jgi:dienelactone hydrolase
VRGRSSSTLTTAAVTVAPPPTSPRTSRATATWSQPSIHSEVVAPEIAGNVQGCTANRVHDARFLLDYILAGAIPCTARPDPDRIAIVGHSAGGWTALALPETDTRIQAVVALAPGGASNPKPGIIPATLSFNWPRPPATLYIVAEDDVLTPIAGMRET